MMSSDVMTDKTARGRLLDEDALRRVTVFGGSRCGPDAGEYQEALQLGRLLVEAGFAVCSGGYAGVMEAISRGEGLATGDYSKGNAGYVAIERVSGTLRGHRGTFILQHSSTVTAGVPRQSISVVPGSGTGELAGISGAMNIRIESGGKHFYDFDYSLPAK